MISGALLVLLLGISYWNYAWYQSTRARRGEVNEQFAVIAARFESLGQEQEQVLARLQTPETAEFLDTLEHVNQLIRRRTFSWTLLLNDLERLTPANLQIVTIKPQIAGQRHCHRDCRQRSLQPGQHPVCFQSGIVGKVL